MTDKIILDFRNIVNLNSLSQLDFPKFTRFMMDKNNQNKTKIFLEHVFKDYHEPNNLKHQSNLYNPKNLLSAYLIHFHHNDVISKEKSYLEKLLLNITNILINGVYDEPFNYVLFNKKYLKWLEVFEYWKKIDKQDLLKKLSNYHKEIRIISNSNLEITEYNQLLQKVEDIAKKIGGKEGVKQVKTSSKYGMIDNEILCQQIKLNLRKVFWQEIVTKDLKSDPPNFTQYPSLVKEICDKFLDILPNLGKDITSEIIKSNLNFEKITQKIQNKTYNLQDIYNLINFCLNKLKELHNYETSKLIEKYITQLDLDMNAQLPIHLIIPKNFEFILEELEIIQSYKKWFNL